MEFSVTKKTYLLALEDTSDGLSWRGKLAGNVGSLTRTKFPSITLRHRIKLCRVQSPKNYNRDSIFGEREDIFYMNTYVFKSLKDLLGIRVMQKQYFFSFDLQLDLVQ